LALWIFRKADVNSRFQGGFLSNRGRQAIAEGDYNWHLKRRNYRIDLSNSHSRRNDIVKHAPMANRGDFLSLLEANEDDLISLIKYEIRGE
jgi:hypothetical protein